MKDFYKNYWFFDIWDKLIVFLTQWLEDLEEINIKYNKNMAMVPQELLLY